MTGNRVATVGSLSLFSHKRAKTTKNIVLRLECVELNCRPKRMLASKRCKHFELGGTKKRKGQVILFKTDFDMQTNRELLLSFKKMKYVR